MAQKVQVLLLDDVDGGQAEETVMFGLDGTSYEIDLSSKNAKALRDTLAKYVGAGRKVGRASGRAAAPRRSSGNSGGGTVPARVDREQNAAIRDWARKNGYDVSDRGRIPAEVVEAYHSKK